MITQLQQLFATVTTQVKPEDLFLQKESWVYFTNQWPDTWKWCSGKLFRVEDEPVIVPYAASYILPKNDYKDIDLSNSTAGLKLYPETEGILYQFKPGDYITHIYVPKEKYVYHLGESSMYPDLTSATLKYLGAKRPSDSPARAPLLFLYFIKDGPAFYLRPYVLDNVDYEKCTIECTINKCKLELIPEPSPPPQTATAEERARYEQEKEKYEEMVKKALKIPYYTEIVGF